MTQNAEPKLEPQRLEDNPSIDGELSLSNEPVKTTEINEESIGLSRKEVAPEAHLENKLSSSLDQYREQLNKGGEKSEGPSSDLKSSGQRSQSKGEFKRLRPSKSQLLRSAPGGTKQSRTFDPLTFIADLIKKFENFILGKTVPEEDLSQKPKVTVKVKRKKKASKRSTSKTKEKGGLYNLEHAAEDEELVDLEVALAEGSVESKSK